MTRQKVNLKNPANLLTLNRLYILKIVKIQLILNLYTKNEFTSQIITKRLQNTRLQFR